jgi:hypothetical protein
MSFTCTARGHQDPPSAESLGPAALAARNVHFVCTDPQCSPGGEAKVVQCDVCFRSGAADSRSTHNSGHAVSEEYGERQKLRARGSWFKGKETKKDDDKEVDPRSGRECTQEMTLSAFMPFVPLARGESDESVQGTVQAYLMQVCFLCRRVCPCFWIFLLSFFLSCSSSLPSPH